MKETICTIPVNEIFEQTGGCPICRMRDIIEKKYIDYITGAAMMEPDVRMLTNAKGFCEKHFRQMLARCTNRLPICQMLHSHLVDSDRKLLKNADSSSAKKLAKLEESCFVCEYIENHFSRSLDTLFRNYKTEPEFRQLFAKQEYLCFPHYRRMLTDGKSAAGNKYAELCETSHKLVCKHSDLLKDQLMGFIESFDYRNAGMPMPEDSRDCIERTIQFLTSRHPSEV
ncbi:MAG: hypothetical protein J6L81_08870 [Clostridia bacterium]|nr:hypothetical protein [Clostridia bacterium]